MGPYIGFWISYEKRLSKQPKEEEKCQPWYSFKFTKPKCCEYISDINQGQSLNTFHILIRDSLICVGPGITGWLPDARPEAQFKVACAFPGAILTRRQIGRSKQTKPALTARNHSRPMLEMRSLGSEFSGVVVVILWLGLDVTPSLPVVRGSATGTIKQVKRPERVWILSSCLCLSPSVCLCLSASFSFGRSVRLLSALLSVCSIYFCPYIVRLCVSLCACPCPFFFLLFFLFHNKCRCRCQSVSIY